MIWGDLPPLFLGSTPVSDQTGAILTSPGALITATAAASSFLHRLARTIIDRDRSSKYASPWVIGKIPTRINMLYYIITVNKLHETIVSSSLVL